MGISLLFFVFRKSYISRYHDLIWYVIKYLLYKKVYYNILIVFARIISEKYINRQETKNTINFGRRNLECRIK